MPGADAAAADPHAGHVMLGALGAYLMARDGSGTSWQPDSAVMHAIHGQYYGWSMMAHGYALFLYDHQGGPRGGTSSSAKACSW